MTWFAILLGRQYLSIFLPVSPSLTKIIFSVPSTGLNFKAANIFLYACKLGSQKFSSILVGFLSSFSQVFTKAMIGSLSCQSAFCSLVFRSFIVYGWNSYGFPVCTSVSVGPRPFSIVPSACAFSPLSMFPLSYLALSCFSLLYSSTSFP